MIFSEIGSVWRKWDLHVHTPYSALNNGFGSDWDVYVKALFTEAINNDIYAIGITDYFTIDGYKKIKQDYLGNNDKMKSLFSEDEIIRIKQILIIPNIEFRLDIIINDKAGKTSKVNFHVIFSEEVPIYQIEENFLHDIDFLRDGNPQGTDQKRKLKVNNLIELGETLKRQHSKFTQPALLVGMMNASVNASQICEVLDKDIFNDKYILAVPCDEDLSRISWDSQGHITRKVLIQRSDCLMSANPSTISWGLGQKSPTIQEYVDEYKSIKPCIWGSDSHDYNELFVKNKDRILWIKSNLSFDGLNQIIHEPKRVFIGIEPEGKRYVDLNPSLFIDNLHIRKTNNLPSGEEWFDKLHIKLNPGLVAIIGNKDSGKSAIADIIGLCGSTKNSKSFSFLNEYRFNSGQEKKGQYFEASMEWRDKLKKVVCLYDKPNEHETERVKYLPQSFLDKLCLGETEKDLFENELRKIIYSRLPTEKKLGKNSLNEIINFKTEVYNQRIEQTKADINILNKKIIELEEQSLPEYIQKVYESLDSASKKFLILQEKMPVQPASFKSTSNSLESSKITEELNTLRSLSENFDQIISTTIQERDNIYIEMQELENSIQFFNSLKSQIDKNVAPHANFLKTYKVELKSIFSYDIDTSIIEQILDSKGERLKCLDLMLSIPSLTENEILVNDITSLYHHKSGLDDKISELQNKLDLPNKEYQIYISEYNNWQVDLESINSEISELKKRRDYLEMHLSHALVSHYKDRTELVTTLFYLKYEEIKIYKELFQPVTSFKENYEKQLANYHIDFDANFIIAQFLENIESFINFGKSGTFFGKDLGIKKINDLIHSYNLSEIDNLMEFHNKLLTGLFYNQNLSDNKLKSVSSQLKQNVRIEDLYDFLFNLEYLKPKFQLKLGGKEIESLSPGERGALLLIFYLLLDNDQIPLIIDQPEENLDNQSIYSILVPFVQEAKERRQVILITHNPNLAVVCDADQIVHVKIDKSNKHIISCSCGSIEDVYINQRLIEVLEGTFPAFDTRNRRYMVTRTRIKYSEVV